MSNPDIILFISKFVATYLKMVKCVYIRDDTTPRLNTSAQHNTLLKFKLEISHFNGGARECDTVERRYYLYYPSSSWYIPFSRPIYLYAHITPYGETDKFIFWRDHRWGAIALYAWYGRLLYNFNSILANIYCKLLVCVCRLLSAIFATTVLNTILEILIQF